MWSCEGMLRLKAGCDAKIKTCLKMLLVATVEKSRQKGRLFWFEQDCHHWFD